MHSRTQFRPKKISGEEGWLMSGEVESSLFLLGGRDGVEVQL